MQSTEGIKLPGDSFPRCLAELFLEETLVLSGLSSNLIKVYCYRMKRIVDNAVQIHSGYVDDSRNTDNAWLENIVQNFHDDGFVFEKYLLSDKGKTLDIHWLKVDSNIDLPADQVEWLTDVANRRKLKMGSSSQ